MIQPLHLLSIFLANKEEFLLNSGENLVATYHIEYFQFFFVFIRFPSETSGIKLSKAKIQTVYYYQLLLQDPKYQLLLPRVLTYHYKNKQKYSQRHEINLKVIITQILDIILILRKGLKCHNITMVPIEISEISLVLLRLNLGCNAIK